MDNIKLDLLRFDHDEATSSGLLAVNNIFECYTLEDQFRYYPSKVSKETRIWDGIYRLGLRRQLTPLTKRYRDKFSWFEYHIEILGIPMFSSVYMHIGNKKEDTEACVLVSDKIENLGDFEDITEKSTQAFERFYKKVYPILKETSDNSIHIKSIWL